jgi:hypothetical protein
METALWRKYDLYFRIIMKRFTLLLFLLLPSQFSQLFSQLTNGEFINQVNTLATREASFTLDYKTVDGSPYYTTEFIKGIVYLRDGSYVSCPLRYDIFRDEIEFMRGNKTFWLIKKDVKCVLYGSETIIMEPTVQNGGKPGYFFLTDTGKYTLMIKKNVVLNPYVPSKGYSDPVPARFVPKYDEFYIKQKGLPEKKINNKKDLATFFIDNKPALDFIKREKIKVNNFEDLHKLLTFLNNQ